MKRANANEVNKTPLYVRYFFMLTSVNGEVSGVTTYRSLKERISTGLIWQICVIDRLYAKLQFIDRKFIESFMEEWRDNYYDINWDIPLKYLKEENCS